jgi:putative two-component system response regulator
MNENIFQNKTPNILIVDDEPYNLQVLSLILKQRGYKVRPVSGGRMAIQAAKIELPDLILLDITMPDMNGYDVCTALKSDDSLKEIPVIFISALNETKDKLKAFSAGGVDYVEKPFHYEEVQSRVQTHLKLHFLQIELEEHNKKLGELVQAQVKEISESQIETIFAIVKLAEARDDDTGKHLEHTKEFCRMLSIQLSGKPGFKSRINQSFIRDIFYASPLHEIGKVAIPDNILLKKGRHTSEEFEFMKKHAALGAQTLQLVHFKYNNNTFIKMGIEIARYHHERWDGTGYPDRLQGELIPFCARIMAIVDVYDALRSKRCYKPALSHKESCEIIVKGSGTQFDPDVVEAFREINEQLDKEYIISAE